MKTSYIIKGMAMGLLFSLGGCSLDKDPLSEYSEVIFGDSNRTKDGPKYKTREEIKTQYDAIYKRMKDNQEHWYLDYLLLAEAHADNAYGGTTGAEVMPFENNSINGSNSVISRDWDRYMTDVATANKVICNIDNVPDLSLTTAERKLWKAEAMIYRALVMFDMVRIWGYFPVVTEEAGDITAENIEDVYPLYFPKQNTPEEAYAQIEKDLLEALPNAPANAASDKTKLSKSVARTLLAKIYAEKTSRDYDKVVKYCDEVIADGFSLVADYADLFAMNADNTDTKTRSTSESILEINYYPGGGNWVSWMLGRNLNNWDENFTWAKWVTPSRDLINAFQTEGDEIRMNQAIVYYDCGWSNYYPNSEYPFAYKCRSGSSSIIKLRYSDVLLLKAEALAHKGDLSGAASLVNTIRARVKLGKLSSADTSSKENLLDAILKERRLELAMEGHRWFDLIRFDKMVTVMNSVYNKDSGRLKQSRLFTEDSALMPVPQTAMDQNSNLVQNKGY